MQTQSTTSAKSTKASPATLPERKEEKGTDKAASRRGATVSRQTLVAEEQVVSVPVCEKCAEDEKELESLRAWDADLTDQ